MSEPAHHEWLRRARAHDAGGRPLDAIVCCRRALDDAPGSVDALFLLGHACWRAGLVREAIDAWKGAVAADATHLASWQMLANALAVQSEWRDAAQAAERVLRLRPDESRATVLRAAIAAAVGGDAGAAAAFARAFDARAAWPLPLLALVAERAALPSEALRGVCAAALAAPVAAGEEDALRVLSLASRRAGLHGESAAFADRYGQCCRAAVASWLPWRWPRRTAGERIRAGVLALAADAEQRALAAELTAIDSGVQWTMMTLGAADAPWKALPQRADYAARVVATLDLDVLVDVAGLLLGCGAVLAARPARATWALDCGQAPFADALADVRFRIERSEASHRVAAALAELRSALPAGAALPAAELSARWDDAVRTHQRGDLAAARDAYAAVLAEQPRYAPAHLLAGNLEREAGAVAAAAAHFDAALVAAPDAVDVCVAAARCSLDRGDFESAARIAQLGAQRSPSSPAVWRALASAYIKRGDAAAALDALARAIAIDPADSGAHFDSGVALQMQQRIPDAAAAYERALAFDPDYVDARFNLAVLLQQAGAADAAITQYENVIAREPASAPAYKNLGEMLLASGRIDAWIENFRRFEARCPDSLTMAVHALDVCQCTGDWARLDRYLDVFRAGALAGDDAERVDALEQAFFVLLHLDIEPEAMLRLAQAYDAAARHVYGTPFARRPTRRPGPLRIGYLSADLREHVMGRMAWSMVEHHDRGRFDLHFYSLSRGEEAWTARFRGVAKRFVALDGVPERAAALAIADDDLDVLVDLSTHTKGAKPGIVALKPARVQITHVASAGTLGLSAVDFKLTDRYADVPGNAAYQLETLLAMEGCVYPYPQIDAAALGHPYERRALGIADDDVVIGAFVSPLKLSRRCLALWRDVLARIPRAKLAFSPLDPALRPLYERLAAAAGIASDRLVYVPRGADQAQNQARYAPVDFVLDTMPYGGVNGVLEPLAADVPVVTLVGTRHGERSAYSILSNLGVAQTIAHSGSEYVEIASRLATDAAFMRSVRAAIRGGIAHSPLTDRIAYTRALERAYVEAIAAKAPEALP